MQPLFSDVTTGGFREPVDQFQAFGQIVVDEPTVRQIVADSRNAERSARAEYDYRARPPAPRSPAVRHTNTRPHWRGAIKHPRSSIVSCGLVCVVCDQAVTLRSGCWS